MANDSRFAVIADLKVGSYVRRRSFSPSGARQADLEIGGYEPLV